MRPIIRASLALIAAWAALSAAAPVAASSTSPLVLHLNFRRVASVNGHCGPEFLTSGSYALASIAGTSGQGCANEFLLLDDRTGKRAVIRPKGFTELLAFGAPWILFTENLTFALYDIDTRKWRSLCVPGACVPGNTFGYHLGARWLQFDVQQPGSCGDGIHFECGPITHSFYNLKSRKAKQVSPSSTTVVDLDSPALVHRVCAPLRVPSGGSLTFYGSYAVANEPAANPALGLFFLGRCGSHSSTSIDESDQAGPVGPVIGNAHAVLWQPLAATGQWNGAFDGMLLPGLRTFTAQLPPSIPITGLSDGTSTVDSFRVYVTDVNGQLWTAALPTSRAKT